MSTCASPGCDKPISGTRVVDGLTQRRQGKIKPSLHCEEHRLQLLRIKEELDNEGRVMYLNGGAPLAKSKVLSRSVPVCCLPHCWAPRVPGNRFCDDHIAEGYVEEDYFT